MGGQVPSGADLNLIIVRAVERLHNACPWACRTKLTTLGFTISQNYVILPIDFGALVKLAGTNSNHHTFCPATLDQILELRAHSPTTTPIGQGQAWYYALSVGEPVSGTLAPRWRRQLFPTPSDTEADAINLAYHDHFNQEVAESAAPDVTVIDAVWGVNSAIDAIVQAEAAKVKVGDGPNALKRWEVLEAAAAREIANARVNDGMAHANLGSTINRYPGGSPRRRPWGEFPVTIS